jgi:ATP-dependent DNA helicase RecG
MQTNKQLPTQESDQVEFKQSFQDEVIVSLVAFANKSRYFKRKGNANHQLSVAEVVDMHLKTLNSSWDAFPDQQHTIEDLSFEKVQAAIDRKNKTQLPTQDDPLTFLNKTGLIRDEKITHAAFFLFHKEESYLSTIELGRFQTEILIKDSARSQSDILTQIDQVIDFVKKHINLEVIITGEAQNKQIWQYPLEAIREIVINMIIHRDYHSSSDSIVKVFADKIEFYNPGRLPEDISVDDLLTNRYRSTPRNKLMADVLKNIGVIEKYGSGIQRIINLFKAENLPVPTFCNISEGFMVTVFSKTDLKTTSAQQEIVVENVVGNVVENVVENESKIIGFLIEKNTLSAKSLANKMEMTERTIQRYLKTLADKGVLSRIGPAKGGHWQIHRHD